VRAFLRRVSYLSSANVVNGVLGIIFVPVAVRRLGNEGYGVFSIYAVLVGYVALVELGLGKNLIRVLASLHAVEDRRDQLRLAWGLYLTVAATLVVVAPVAAWLVPRVLFPVEPAQRATVQWIALLAIADYVLAVPVFVMQNRCIADEQFDRYSRFVVASGLVRYGISFAAVFAFVDPAQVVAAIVLRRFGDILLARRLMGALPSGAWKPRFDRRDFARMAGHSSALSLAQLLQITVVSVGAMLVNYVFGLRALGIYRAAFDLAAKVWFFSNVVGFVVFPRFVRLLADREGRARLGIVLPSVLQTSWLAYSVLAILAVIVGPWVLPLMGLGGDEYVRLFLLLIVGVSFNAHTNLAYEFLQATGRYRTVAALAAFSLAGLLGTFVAVAGVAGLLAIGWAWLGSQIVYGVVSDARVFRAIAVRGRLTVRDLLARGAGVVAVLLFLSGGLRGGMEFRVVGATVAVLAVLLSVTDLRQMRTQYRPA